MIRHVNRQQAEILKELTDTQTITPDISLCVVDINAVAARALEGIRIESFRCERNRKLSPNDVTVRIFSRDEFHYLNSFKSLKKQMEWMAGRLAVKTLVAGAEKDGLDLTEVEISYLPQGAPYLKNGPAYPVSISHSQDYAVAGLSRQRAIRLGLDIEKIASIELDFLRKIAFSQRENEQIRPNDHKSHYSLWTLKEAYLKYLQLGFHENLQMVEMIDKILYYRQKRVENIKIHSEEIRKGYAFTLMYSLFVSKHSDGDSFIPAFTNAREANE
jgi:4'-phosphopantetheinyl transferase